MVVNMLDVVYYLSRYSVRYDDPMHYTIESPEELKSFYHNVLFGGDYYVWKIELPEYCKVFRENILDNNDRFYEDFMRYSQDRIDEIEDKKYQDKLDMLFHKLLSI